MARSNASASARTTRTPATKKGAHVTAKRVMPKVETNAIPTSEANAQPMKDMSPDAVRQRRSDAQKKAVRITRTSTSHVRAKELEAKLSTAKEGQETVYDTMKSIWSSRGEIVASLAGGKQVEVKRSDVIRQLKALPRDAKTPFKLTPHPTDKLVHILA